MPSPQRSRFVEWFVLLRDEWLPSQRERITAWYEVVREEPFLIWHTPAIRYGVYALGCLLAVWLLVWAASLLEPAPAKDAGPRARTANFHVVCSDPECGHHFMIAREFGFKKFPVKCPKCGEKTGQRGVRCNSPACRGRFVTTTTIDGELRCNQCGAVLGPAP
ncbi:MAG TPA: hypothetical protein VM243_06670 [Phycisphaerae bacterium]|nr:hypothetical protein [Phycisphaerae bacterium]